MSALRVERIDDGPTDEQVRALHEVWCAVEREVFPGDPLPEPERLRLDITERASHRHRPTWLAWLDGEPAGWGAAELPDTADNRDKSEVWVEVHPDRRGKGVGSTLTRIVAEAALADGRAGLIGYLAVGGPHGEGEANGHLRFARRMGLEPKQRERSSRMATADIPRAELEEWVARAPERAAEYSLLTWEGPVDPAHAERFAAVKTVMNTAPLDDLELEDEAPTAEEVLADGAAYEARGFVPRVVVVRHDPTDAWVGFTALFLDRYRPGLAEQGDTGVDPAHRNRGLGRWVKAANALWLLDEHPEVVAVRTYNAASNDAMLGINVAMGFRPACEFLAVQGPAQAVLDATA